LSQIDRLLVKQKVELLEGIYSLNLICNYFDFFNYKLAFTGWETSNKYAILNAAGQQVYYAFEGYIIVYFVKIYV
jgi:hypothetical protein